MVVITALTVPVTRGTVIVIEIGTERETMTAIETAVGIGTGIGIGTEVAETGIGTGKEAAEIQIATRALARSQDDRSYMKLGCLSKAIWIC